MKNLKSLLNIMAVLGILIYWQFGTPIIARHVDFDPKTGTATITRTISVTTGFGAMGVITKPVEQKLEWPIWFITRIEPIP